MQREVLHVDLGYIFSLPKRGLHACSRDSFALLFLFYNYMCRESNDGERKRLGKLLGFKQNTREIIP